MANQTMTPLKGLTQGAFEPLSHLAGHCIATSFGFSSHVNRSNRLHQVSQIPDPKSDPRLISTPSHWKQIDANTLNTHFASMSTDPSYKTPPKKATTINSRQHQQFTPYSVLHMLTKACPSGTGFQTFHALKTLRSHGLRGVKLFDITESLIISRIKYAAPSWSGFATQQQLQQLQSLIKKLIRFNYLSA
ncbi:hypothetical protein HELRODRAFT_172779 [Helobdella robusta]|uniref:Uncharacterized protein n=1 Tax=Helobdella robusta TaxID=6412 RepID=T1F5X9_HELRO|nr:hypothetical protein HELRODRAFT_172779 [Helobdella robusta]ESO04397.1 hypothetical protein HELRODRAFT_172779 [Helobdella robusta]